MALDLTRPKGERRLVPGANTDEKPGPLCPDIVYFMDGTPNVFEVWGTVSGLLQRGGYPDVAREYRDKALALSDRYEDVIEFTHQYVHVIHVASGVIE